MPTTYSLADDDVKDLLADALRQWHRPLFDAGVKFGVLMAFNPSGPAVKHGGYPAAATVRVVPLKDRVTKGYDAEVVIDLRWWEARKKKHRVALLDHEASHVELAKIVGYSTEDGSIRFDRDDIGRPKLRLRKGDWNAGDGFAAVVGRHEDFAVEFENLDYCWSRAKAAKAGDPDGDTVERHPSDIPGGDREQEG